jgi:hypothetical protein
LSVRVGAGGRLAELGGVAPLGAVVLLVANDRVGKPLFHNAVTGKLSDVAICFLLPLLVSAALGLFVRWRGEWRLWVGAVTGAAVFALLEMSDVAGGLFLRALRLVGIAGVLTRDPTDLAALACVPLAVAYGRMRLRASPRHPRWATAGGALALVTGSLALMATSEPSKCGEYSAPVVFQADGNCGPGGVVVVEADGQTGSLAISNPGALGLPPLGQYIQSLGSVPNGRYNGDACPYTLASGEWHVIVGSCPAAREVPDAGSDAGLGVDAGCPASFLECTAAVESGTLWFTCDVGDPAVPSCRSRLTVLP